METKTEAPELTRDLIDKAMLCGRPHAEWVVVAVLETVVLLDGSKETAARVLSNFIEVGH